MTVWKAIVLGAVQGVAEFLPISSSGHLLLLQKIFNVNEGAFFYSVVLHLGTLIPITVILKNQIKEYLKPKKLPLVLIATLPAGFIGLLLELCFGIIGLDIDTLFLEKTYLLGIAFFISALEMVLANAKNKKTLTLGINKKTALIMGLGQAVGVLPGISRSGSTVLGGSLAKVNREENASFTFIMSIPIILASICFTLIKQAVNPTPVRIEILPLIFGLISSSVFGYVSIRCMLKIIKRANYTPFVIYLIFVCIITFII